MENRDYLSKKAIEELEDVWGRESNPDNRYYWRDEFDRYVKSNMLSTYERYRKDMDIFVTDLYALNSDQAGIGMQETIITDGNFYPMPKNKYILDFCCGNGDLIKYLKDDNKFIIGVDIGKLGIEKGRDKGNFESGALLWMDVCRQRLPFLNDFFDIVFFTEAIEHLDNPLFALVEIKRVLKEGGHLVLTHPEQEDQLGGFHGNHPLTYPGLFRRNDFRRFMIQMFFKLIKYKENGGTAKYVFKNYKHNFINPFAVVKGDFKINLVYEKIRNWNEDLERPVPVHPHNIELAEGQQKPGHVIDSRVSIDREMSWVVDKNKGAEFYD